jgi:hypothetical protein
MEKCVYYIIVKLKYLQSDLVMLSNITGNFKIQF